GGGCGLAVAGGRVDGGSVAGWRVALAVLVGERGAGGGGRGCGVAVAGWRVAWVRVAGLCDGRSRDSDDCRDECERDLHDVPPIWWPSFAADASGLRSPVDGRSLPVSRR